MKTRIGIFDSGIGGVTVLGECMRLVPNFQYLYYSDSIHNPYGDKNEEDVIGYCNNIVKFFTQNGCKIIVIACNTASAIAVRYLRERYTDIYFIAIEPAVKLAYDMSNDGTLIMATKGTMDSEKFRELYSHYHHDAVAEYLNIHLSRYKGKVLNVVLGCTHYPLIKKEICKILGNVTFYDGAVGVSKQLKRIVDEYNFMPDGDSGVLFKDSSFSFEKEERFKMILEGLL